ncbi:unnamed protein product [Protopolystoma xenopodis]|uniref:Uncharacterized protein n=1 Tax=Protopolystoma xenopodis TaxID=117903 RepID=A0A3S5AX09_9PLAT|nr:unnamed protein product [Protopolystoma xenopodis]
MRQRTDALKVRFSPQNEATEAALLGRLQQISQTVNGAVSQDLSQIRHNRSRLDALACANSEAVGELTNSTRSLKEVQLAWLHRLRGLTASQRPGDLANWLEQAWMARNSIEAVVLNSTELWTRQLAKDSQTLESQAEELNRALRTPIEGPLDPAGTGLTSGLDSERLAFYAREQDLHLTYQEDKLRRILKRQKETVQDVKNAQPSTILGLANMCKHFRFVESMSSMRLFFDITAHFMALLYFDSILSADDTLRLSPSSLASVVDKEG